MLPVLLLALAPAAVGQNSIVKQYSALVGDSVLIRTDNTTFVTCCNTTNMRSCFVVDNGTTCHQFYTTQVPSGIYITDSGYVVKDMQLVNGVCWFAGYKWFDTGQPVYTPGGEVYNLVTYKAFVGKFNTANVLSGSGNYSIIEISGLHHIERLAVIGNNVTAIGVKANGVRQLVELQFQPSNSKYNLHIENSVSSHEVFMDVVAAGNKVVLLSRYKDSWGFNRSTYYFGLRYGNAGNMLNTSGAIQYYDVYNALDWRLGFPSVHPMRLASTNNGNGVVIAYIAQRNDYPNSLYGKYVMFHIATENSSTADVIINMYDNYQYTELADIRFNKPVTNNTYMALLLRDSTSNSILRFPLLNIPYSTSENVFTTNNPYIESVAPYQTGSNGLELAATGHFTGSSPYLSQITQKGIYSNPSYSCLAIGSGNIYPIKDASCKAEEDDFELAVVSTSNSITFKNTPYTSTIASKTTICSTKNQ